MVVELMKTETMIFWMNAICWIGALFGWIGTDANTTRQTILKITYFLVTVAMGVGAFWLYYFVK